MLSQSYYLRQAETCLSLARMTADPAMKQRYEFLAIEFVERLDDETEELASEAAAREGSARASALCRPSLM